MIAKTWWVALLCGAALTWPAMAQQGGAPEEAPTEQAPEAEVEKAEEPPAEPVKTKAPLEDPPLHRWGGFTVSLALWSPSLVGADDQVAVIMDPGGNLPRPLFISTSSDMRQSVMGAYHLPQNMGSIVGRYESMNDDDEIFQSSPGEFIYAETLLPAGFRGAFDDGLMDTVVGSSQNRNREVRLEYSNTAWQTARTRATWSAGFRNVDHNELLQVTYYALVPNLPTIIPPIVDEAQNPAQWHPIPDRVVLQSDYMGTGAGAALDAEFTFHPRFSVISGLSVGLLRGKVTTTYKGFTSYYTNALEGGRYVGRDELFQTLQFGTQNEILAISQRVVEEGYYAPDVSQSAQTFDAYVGVQSIVWRGLRVFATFREMYYQNVATDAVLLPDLTLETEKKSVGYEGYLVGVSWRF